MKTKITPFLMFAGQAEKAMNFYVSLFPDASVISIKRYGADGPGAEGSVVLASFSLAGQTILCIDSPAKHDFTFTPAISLFVDCTTEQQLDELFAKLSDRGKIMMPPNNYGFSRKFTWVADRFDVSWQINLPAE